VKNVKKQVIMSLTLTPIQQATNTNSFWLDHADD
jgi:hypothetical protein